MAYFRQSTETNPMASDIAVIVGAGSGLSAALARACAKRDMGVVLAARDIAKLSELAAETDARLISCDAVDRRQVDALFRVVGEVGVPALVVYNASYRARGPFVELGAADVERSVQVTALGGFHVAQAAARQMLPLGRGSIFFTGASASVKGYAQSAPFAMGKFALRGLAQSMARELAPNGLHVAHFVIDGGISRGPQDPRRERGADGLLDPAAIAETYLHVHAQPRSAWTWEVELRPWIETF
jgi:NAD(P)-dependent dehydrogenase (short-subunit alcohol dehydrogenase family)